MVFGSLWKPLESVWEAVAGPLGSLKKVLEARWKPWKLLEAFGMQWNALEYPGNPLEAPQGLRHFGRRLAPCRPKETEQGS